VDTIVILCCLVDLAVEIQTASIFPSFVFLHFLFLLHFFHHFLSGTFWTNYVLAILNKSFSNHRLIANVAKETLVVPGQGLERDKLCAAKASFACDGFCTGGTTL